MSKTNTQECLTLPINFDRKEFTLEDLEFLCICGHYVNEHDGGLGGGDSLCEVENCGCVSCEFDYESTITFHYFQEKNDRWLISKLTADGKRQWTMGHFGFPSVKEFEPIEVINK